MTCSVQLLRVSGVVGPLPVGDTDLLTTMSRAEREDGGTEIRIFICPCLLNLFWALPICSKQSLQSPLPLSILVLYFHSQARYRFPDQIHGLFEVLKVWLFLHMITFDNTRQIVLVKV